jgi:hypothetical protein
VASPASSGGSVAPSAVSASAAPSVAVASTSLGSSTTSTLNPSAVDAAFADDSDSLSERMLTASLV